MNVSEIRRTLLMNVLYCSYCMVLFPSWSVCYFYSYFYSYYEIIESSEVTELKEVAINRSISNSEDYKLLRFLIA